MADITSGVQLALFADDINAWLAENSPEDQAYLHLDRRFTQHLFGKAGKTDIGVKDANLTLHIRGDRDTIPAKLRKLADDLEKAAQDFERLHPPDDMLEDDEDIDTLPTKNDVDALAELDEVAAWYAEQDRREEDPYSRVMSLGNPPAWDDERGEDEYLTYKEGRVLSEGYIDRQTGKLVIEY